MKTLKLVLWIVMIAACSSQFQKKYERKVNEYFDDGRKIACNSLCEVCHSTINRCIKCVKASTLIYETFCKEQTDSNMKMYKSLSTIFFIVVFMGFLYCGSTYSNFTRLQSIKRRNFTQIRILGIQQMRQERNVPLFDNGLSQYEGRERIKRLMRVDKKNQTCSICLDDLTDFPVEPFPCLSHIGHRKCVKLWMKSM